MLLVSIAYLTTVACAVSTFTRPLHWFLPITGLRYINLEKKYTKRNRKEHFLGTQGRNTSIDLIAFYFPNRFLLPSMQFSQLFSNISCWLFKE